jgi:hypothetical protein
VIVIGDKIFISFLHGEVHLAAASDFEGNSKKIFVPDYKNNKLSHQRLIAVAWWLRYDVIKLMCP